jgi:hypothetical protein
MTARAACGIVTAYEAAGHGSVNFVGDARLPLLPRSTCKFVTFAPDSKTDIRREDKGVLRTQLSKAVNGVLTLTTRLRRSISVHGVQPPRQLSVAKLPPAFGVGRPQLAGTPLCFR